MNKNKSDEARQTKAGMMSENSDQPTDENVPETKAVDADNSENTPKISKQSAEDKNRKRPLH